MKIRGLTTGILALAIAGAAAAAGGGDEKKAARQSVDEKAMMEAWQKAATPGDAHKTLEPFVGTWDTKVTTWMQPGAPPEETMGVSENRWILGNRFIEQRYEGQFMGAPFTGIGYTGYDNVKKKYIGSWMDSMGTSIMTSTGTADTAGKVMTFTATMDDPLTGKSMPVKTKISVADNDHNMMEMWAPAPDGKMYKNMEIVYTRKK